MSVDTTRDTLEDFLDINLLNRDDELTISDFAGGKGKFAYFQNTFYFVI